MRIVFEASQAEKKELLYKCLCNMQYALQGVGLFIETDGKEYDDSLNELVILRDAKRSKETICIEDVWIYMLSMNRTVRIMDSNEEEIEEAGKVTLKGLHDIWDKIPEHIMMDLFKEAGDSWTAFDFVQWVTFGENRYG